MSARARALIAAVIWLATAFLTVCALVLLVATWSAPIRDEAWGFRGFPAFFALSMSTVGALIASRRSNAVGWLLCGAGLMAAVQVFAEEYTIAGIAGGWAWLAGAPLLGWVVSWIWVPFLGCVGLALLLFPDGRPPSRRWLVGGTLILAGALIFAIGFAIQPGQLQGFTNVDNPFVSGGTELSGALAATGQPLFVGGLLAAAASLVVRFRQARRDEREQIKWVAWSAFVVALALPAGFTQTKPGSFVLIGAITLVPLAAGIAILRYRLYDIDLVINRTLVYGALSAILGAGYVASVVVLQAALGSFTSGDQLEIAIATLLVAAAFRPLRNAIQRFIDRRFYRRRYDATQTIAAFAARLRDEVELDAISGDLLTVVHQTVQPAASTLWLRGSAPLPASGASAAARR